MSTFMRDPDLEQLVKELNGSAAPVTAGNFAAAEQAQDRIDPAMLAGPMSSAPAAP